MTNSSLGRPTRFRFDTTGVVAVHDRLAVSLTATVIVNVPTVWR